MGGVVGSNENMWPQRRAFIHRTRLSTSLAMGPPDDNTNLITNTKKGKYPGFVTNNLLTMMILLLLTSFLTTNNGDQPPRADQNTRNHVMRAMMGNKTDQHSDTHLIRPVVGLKPHMPQKAAGMRMLPPMSLPMPSGEPPPPMRAPSPPDEPPEVFWKLWGLTVCP